MSETRPPPPAATTPPAVRYLADASMMSPPQRRTKRRRPGTRLSIAPSNQGGAQGEPGRNESDCEPAKKLRTEASFPPCNPVQDALNFSRAPYRVDLANRGLLVRGNLGSGSYSKVKMVLNATRNPAEMVAVKIVDRDRAPKDYLDHFLPRELQIWSRMNHPNLVKLLDYFEGSYRVYMVLEFVSGGDALAHIQKTGAVSEALAKTWLVQITGAVRYMHDRNVSHRDLKLENLLLTNHNMTIKLCDFGFVKEVANSEELSQTFCGSKAYAAPEILKGQPYDPKKVDVWALGVITYILVTGKMPFDETRGTKRILEDQMALKLQWNKVVRISTKCHQLILRMLTWNFAERPTIQRVQRDEWFAPDPPLPPLVETGGAATSGGGGVAV